MCSDRRYISTDMHHYLFRSGLVLDLRSNFENDLLTSNDNSFDASRREEHDAVKMNVMIYEVKSYYRNIFRKKRLFYNPRARFRKNVKRAIECVLPWGFSSSGSRVMCRFVEKYRKGKIGPLVTSGDLTFEMT